MSLTGKLGQYRTEVTNLSGAKFDRYENIFKVYTQPTNGKQFYFYNLEFVLVFLQIYFLRLNDL